MVVVTGLLLGLSLMHPRFILPSLPKPPSVNESYCPVNNRIIKTAKAKSYQQMVINMLRQQGWTTKLADYLEYHVEVDLIFYVYKPNWYTKTGTVNRNAGDTDNNIKLLQDAIFKSCEMDDSAVWFSGCRKMSGDETKVIPVFTKSPDIVDMF